MTTRSHNPDTEADQQVFACLAGETPRCFSLIAGAGSGKTTSLIKAIAEVIKQHGKRLSNRRKRIACITYTEIAAREIWSDIGEHPLVHVSTIHSFLWSFIRSFQGDIRVWVEKRITEKIAEKQADAAKFTPRVHQRTRTKNAEDTARYQAMALKIHSISSFTYGTGSDYAHGILGHDDILRLATELISSRPLLRQLLAQQHPFVFVDESQDTSEDVIKALLATADGSQPQFCLGFFGDPMQQIYQTGIGDVPSLPTWVKITKRQNFRCSLPVLHVANAIRRPSDGIEQVAGRPVPINGSASIFILDNRGARDERIEKVRTLIARTTRDSQWAANPASNSVKVLVIVHRMAAKRHGFGTLYAALNDKAPNAFKDGFLDGTAWPLRPFVQFVMPLVAAKNNNDTFAVMHILRNLSPLLQRKNLKGVDMNARLAALEEFAQKAQSMTAAESSFTISNLLREIKSTGVIDLDPKFLTYLAPGNPLPVAQGQAATTEDAEELTKEIRAMDAFLACPASDLRGYFSYINDQSPFSTQQGIKGAEFDRVLVIADDEESSYFLFSYERYFGVLPLSETDLKNQTENNETTIDRTRRLFYVCCTRARKDLVVIYFTINPHLARTKIIQQGLFPESSIFLDTALAGV